MAKQIILKNTTGSGISYLGALIKAGDQNDFTAYPLDSMRDAGEAGLYADIASGDIVVNDGTNDLSAAAGRSYVANDIDTGAPVYYNNTSAVLIPIGTTAQRPSSPEEGMLRKNTDLAALELYQDGIWTPVGIFGMWYTMAESLTVTSTTEVAWLEKLKLTTPNVVAGTYRLNWRFLLNHNSVGSDIEIQVEQDDTTILELYKQEPKDARANDGRNNVNPVLADEVDAGGGNYQFSTTGSAQRYLMSGQACPTLGAGVHTFDIDFRTDDDNHSSSLWNVRMEFWRLT